VVPIDASACIHVNRRLLSRHPEVVLADDITAVEHAAGEVAGYGHGHTLGAPARTIFLVRRRSWKSLSGTPAAWQAVALRKSPTGSPSRWNTSGATGTRRRATACESRIARYPERRRTLPQMIGDRAKWIASP
jgi:hypothetical protein